MGKLNEFWRCATRWVIKQGEKSPRDLNIWYRYIITKRRYVMRMKDDRMEWGRREREWSQGLIWKEASATVEVWAVRRTMGWARLCRLNGFARIENWSLVWPMPFFTWWVDPSIHGYSWIRRPKWCANDIISSAWDFIVTSRSSVRSFALAVLLANHILDGNIKNSIQVWISSSDIFGLLAAAFFLNNWSGVRVRVRVFVSTATTAKMKTILQSRSEQEWFGMRIVCIAQLGFRLNLAISMDGLFGGWRTAITRMSFHI